ncbi:hypothetical protein IW140_003384 [Coemansia sp. RSA 1813]|nr:hypothetical protein EV178_003202 [Coemansia sp. RSA 1646]KAJ1771009.1 hypothetical protein LPJ74_002700 [Coemansia sp. RSA 1843]KAJ2215078.1 hypothetical protein EV179_002446 [Coemansia sp. RSA 487]KAJ2569019.1 hypothetical protein IW140_003384 [Coemansia sp. RSA 1813]
MSPVPRGIYMRQVAGCPAGYTNCDMFGCIEGTACPDTCSKRQSADTCAVSVNGNGCKWTYNTCVQDIQCFVNSTGGCSSGCKGCGEFQCIIEGLTCPTPCSLRSQDKCNTAAFYNGLGCSWIGNECVTWNFVANAPLAGNVIQATEGQVLTSTVTVDIIDTVTPSYSSTAELSSSTTSSTATSTSTSTTSKSSSHRTKTKHSPSTSSEESSSSEKESSSEIPTSSEPTPSEEPSESPSSDITHIEEKPKSKGLSVAVIVVIVIVALGLVGLISWIGLYRFTKNKSNSVSPRVFAQPGIMPANQLPMYSSY